MDLERAGGVKLGQREQALVLHTAQGEAVAAPYAGLFEDMLEVDFDGSGADAELASYLFVFVALFDEFHDLLFSRGRFAVVVFFGPCRLAKEAGCHPTGA